VLRFDRVERAAHWLTALLVLTLSVTGAILYVPSLSVAVGRRLLIEDIHVYAGVAVFAPLAVAAAGPWGRRLRADLASMNRFSTSEVAWLRSLGRRGRQSIGKFNPGQKLNTFGIGALLLVLLVTGLILRWGNFLAVSWRTGATFVHDWFALAVIIVALGHILFAVTHPPALRSMVTGTVRRSWLTRHAPAWRVDAANAGTSDVETTGTGNGVAGVPGRGTRSAPGQPSRAGGHPAADPTAPAPPGGGAPPGQHRPISTR
jgi:formate dehydrogenase subunit gamma